MRQSCLLYKVFKLSHIHSLFPQMRNSYKHPNTFHVFYCRTEYFKNFFFPYVVNKWNKLHPNIRTCSTYNIFCNALLKFIRPAERKIFSINRPFGIKMLDLGEILSPARTQI